MDSYSEGKIDAVGSNFIYIGGLVGYSTESAIYNTYSTGDVKGHTNNWNPYVGGLVGYNNIGTIRDCFALGDVCGTSNDTFSPRVGGIVGMNKNDGVVGDCYRLNTQSITGGIIENIGIPTTENDFKSVKLYRDILNFREDIWNVSNEIYPTLKK